MLISATALRSVWHHPLLSKNEFLPCLPRWPNGKNLIPPPESQPSNLLQGSLTVSLPPTGFTGAAALTGFCAWFGSEGLPPLVLLSTTPSRSTRRSRWLGLWDTHTEAPKGRVFWGQPRPRPFPRTCLPCLFQPLPAAGNKVWRAHTGPALPRLTS